MTGALPSDGAALLRAKLNSETARVEWRALQRFFAAGKTIHVGDGQDLVEIGYTIAGDDKGAVERLMQSGEVSRVSNDTARRWYETDAVVWALVVRPFVLVQEPDLTAGSK